MLIEALLGRGMGAGTRLNAVRPSGLVGLGYGVGFNLNGGMCNVTANSPNSVGDEGKVVI